MRPEKGTYPPYYSHYLGLVPEDNLIDALYANSQLTAEFISKIPESKGSFRYAEGKWSVKDVLGHICDTERILCYRALRFARRDAQQPLPFDENSYAQNAGFDNRTVKEIATEFGTVRNATISLFTGFSDEVHTLSGKTAAGEATVLAIGYMICGHAAHHVNVIRERYLSLKK